MWTAIRDIKGRRLYTIVKSLANTSPPKDESFFQYSTWADSLPVTVPPTTPGGYSCGQLPQRETHEVHLPIISQADRQTGHGDSNLEASGTSTPSLHRPSQTVKYGDTLDATPMLPFHAPIG